MCHANFAVVSDLFHVNFHFCKSIGMDFLLGLKNEFPTGDEIRFNFMSEYD